MIMQTHRCDDSGENCPHQHCTENRSLTQIMLCWLTSRIGCPTFFRPLLVIFLFLVTRPHEIFIAAPNFHYDDVDKKSGENFHTSTAPKTERETLTQIMLCWLTSRIGCPTFFTDVIDLQQAFARGSVWL